MRDNYFTFKTKTIYELKIIEMDLFKLSSKFKWSFGYTYLINYVYVQCNEINEQLSKHLTSLSSNTPPPPLLIKPTTIVHLPLTEDRYDTSISEKLNDVSDESNLHHRKWRVWVVRGGFLNK